MNNRNQNQQNPENGKNDYYQFLSTGIGYVNFLEERKNGNGGTFTTCQIAVCVGPKNAEPRQYEYVNIIVTGQKTEDLLWSFAQDFENKRGVFVQFTMEGIYSRSFTRQDGSHDSSLNAKLIGIDKVWIDKELVFDADPKDEQAPAQNQEQPSNGRQAPSARNDQGQASANRNARSSTRQSSSNDNEQQRSARQNNQNYSGRQSAARH